MKKKVSVIGAESSDLAPIHHTKWVEEMDDSLECYLKN
jgi:hypothetical protein